MFKGLNNFFDKASNHGLKLPFAWDPVSKKPSITLLFPYVTFAMAVISLIVLHFYPTAIIATAMTLLFWAMSVVFYLLRKLSKAKFDLDDKSIDLEGGQPDE